MKDIEVLPSETYRVASIHGEGHGTYATTALFLS